MKRRSIIPKYVPKKAAPKSPTAAAASSSQSSSSTTRKLPWDTGAASTSSISTYSPKSKTTQSSSPKSTRVPKTEITISVHSSGVIQANPSFHKPVESLFASLPPDFQWDSNAHILKFPMSCYDQFLYALKPLKAEGIITKIHFLPTFISDKMKEVSVYESDEVIHQKMNENIPKTLLDQLMPFQRTGVFLAIKKGGRVLLGDEMGLGKTIQAITLCTYYKQNWPVLIICPSSLRLTWRAEICKWLSIDEERVQVIYTRKSIVDTNADFVLCSYDLASKPEMVEQFRNREFGIVVADESHYLKSRIAKRTQSLLPLLQKSPRALLLSGTPALSRPVELYTQIDALIPYFTGSHQFGLRYCAGFENRYGWDYTGHSNISELHWYLDSTILIRRLKHDVLKELPSKTRQCIYVSIPSKAQITFRNMMETRRELDAQLGDAQRTCNGEKTKQVGMEKRAHLMKMYTETGRAKLGPVTEYLGEVYQNTTKKFIVFAHHTSVLNGVSDYLKSLKAKYIRIDGTTPPQLRQGLCDQFQMEEDTRVAVLSITAAGVGLTLHAADMVLFAELFWNPAQLLQGEDRAHRIGREGNVDVKYILAKGTLDDVQWPLISQKLQVVGQSIDGYGTHMQVGPAEEQVLNNEDEALDVFEGLESTTGWQDEDVDDESAMELVQMMEKEERRVGSGLSEVTVPDQESELLPGPIVLVEDEVDLRRGECLERPIKGKRKRTSIVLIESDSEEGGGNHQVRPKKTRIDSDSNTVFWTWT
ncbi:P-loop containing nucleoside triphosphate hydrolase protein [Phlyctochytrium arcticum]|nr:P-loop containing nucleoside triphosphate hydrolase protein [Phlyctochytrium arcticum]